MTRLVLTLWSIVVLVIAGCTSIVRGDAAPSPELASEMARQRVPIPAKTALGDFATIDYCDLLTTMVLPEDWQRGDQWWRLDNCELVVHNGERRVVLIVGNLMDRRLRQAVWNRDRSHSLPGQLYVERPSTEPDDLTCTRGIAFPDQITLTVMGTGTDGEPPRHLVCEAVNLVVESIVADLVDNRLLGHFVEFDDGSLIRRDVCALVPSSLVAAARKTSKSAGYPSVSGHKCTWPGGGRGPVVIVAVELARTDFGDTRRSETLEGRKSIVDAGDDGCLMSTEYADIPQSNGTYEDKEVLTVVVLDMPGAEACGAARKIAKGLWPKLPK